MSDKRELLRADLWSRLILTIGLIMLSAFAGMWLLSLTSVRAPSSARNRPPVRTAGIFQTEG